MNEHVPHLIVFLMAGVAVTICVIHHNYGLGHVVGIPGSNFFDFIYYSSVVFTTVGFGDLVPVGAIRILTAVEGLALITWSVLFTFLAMQRLWPHLLFKPDNENRH